MEHRALISYFAIASTAGHDTTAAITGTGMAQLAQRPDILADLKANPDRIPGFVEETIRWATLVQQFVRSATQDYDIKGRTIKKGDLIYLSYLSANRDEEAFPDPFTFDHTPNAQPPCRLRIWRAYLPWHPPCPAGNDRAVGRHSSPRLKSVELTGPVRMAESEFVCGA